MKAMGRFLRRICGLEARGTLRPLTPHRFGFDLNYWRGRPDLIKTTQGIYASRWFQEWFSVLNHELPLDSIEAVRAHKRVLRLIELMGQPLEEPAKELPPTFGAEKDFPELVTDELNAT